LRISAGPAAKGFNLPKIKLPARYLHPVCSAAKTCDIAFWGLAEAAECNPGLDAGAATAFVKII
jgi:hypothetical protein